MAWIIINSDDTELVWSNVFGWCDTNFDTFDDDEKDSLALPMGGEWLEVSWKKES